MGKLLEQLRANLYSANTDQQIMAARQLSEQRDWDALRELLRLLAQDECGFSVAEALRAYGPEVCDPVGLLLMDENKAVQYRAAWVLVAFGDQRAIKPMLAALSEPYFNEQFIPTLHRMGLPELDRLLVRELSRHRQSTNLPSARFRAATFFWALTQMRSRAAIELVPHFTDQAHDPLVRQRAQQYLSVVAPERREQAG